MILQQRSLIYSGIEILPWLVEVILMSSRWLVFLILYIIKKTCSTTLDKANVELVPVGKSVKLQCPTNERTTSLQLVKWFKDGKEFCRYYPHFAGRKKHLTWKSLPQYRPEIYCEETNVDLGEASWMYDGVYVCQIFLAEKKKSKVVARSVSLLVYPKSGPVISGIKEFYEEGEMILANCTAAPSNPPPSMIWYLNGVTADGWSMFTYPCSVTEDGLCVLRLGLKLQARKKIFPKGQASFVCEAGILALPPKRTFITTRLIGLNSTGKMNTACKCFIGILLWHKILF